MDSQIIKFLNKNQLDRLDLLPDLMKALNYSFRNEELLIRALTHSSMAKEITKRYSSAEAIPWNERLEFLGDSVLSLAISTKLIGLAENHDEGVLSKMRAHLVSESSLASLARGLKLGDFLLISGGESKGGDSDNRSILADAFEAILGAIYLDSDFATVKSVILKLFDEKLKTDTSDMLENDYKSRLQELTQSQFKRAPTYSLTDRRGPDHNAVFEIEVEFDGLVLGIGTGPSKKQASQDAAKKALVTLERNPSLLSGVPD